MNLASVGNESIKLCAQGMGPYVVNFSNVWRFTIDGAHREYVIEDRKKIFLTSFNQHFRSYNASGYNRANSFQVEKNH